VRVCPSVRVCPLCASAPCARVPLVRVCPLCACAPCARVPLVRVCPLCACAPCARSAPCARVPLVRVCPLCTCAPCARGHAPLTTGWTWEVPAGQRQPRSIGRGPERPPDAEAALRAHGILEQRPRVLRWPCALPGPSRAVTSLGPSRLRLPRRAFWRNSRFGAARGPACGLAGRASSATPSALISPARRRNPASLPARGAPSSSAVYPLSPASAAGTPACPAWAPTRYSAQLRHGATCCCCAGPSEGASCPFAPRSRSKACCGGATAGWRAAC